MGWYTQNVLPYLLRFAMQYKVLAHIRQRLIPEATGEVLEIGFGSGANLPFYSDNIRSVTAIDPSRELRALAEKTIHNFASPFDFVLGTAAEMPFASNRYDTVVCTWTLCSTADPTQVLDEIRRVLKPSGTLLFAEHALAPDPGVQKWQNRLNPLWQRIAGGCNINRPALELLQNNGFQPIWVESDYIPGPRFLCYTHRGVMRCR